RNRLACGPCLGTRPDFRAIDNDGEQFVGLTRADHARNRSEIILGSIAAAAAFTTGTHLLFAGALGRRGFGLLVIDAADPLHRDLARAGDERDGNSFLRTAYLLVLNACGVWFRGRFVLSTKAHASGLQTRRRRCK